MKFISLNNKSVPVSFRTATLKGLAPDKGLYFPEAVPKFGATWIENFAFMEPVDCCYQAIAPFIGEDIPDKVLREIIVNTIDFPFPLKQLDNDVFSLELFHGPTLAFKDVGARFMAQCLGYFQQSEKLKNVKVLVATSGDTGGAVAHGFYKVEGVEVIILYPSGQVSPLQEKQLTTLGHNITAIEVKGSFDDCQAMVKTAFLDEEIKKHASLTSANSINVARWLPQMFYYMIALAELKRKGVEVSPVISVPSGNFGNICAGLLLQAMGMPIDHFVASVNSNQVVPEYLKNGIYEPSPSISTISNAMDVGNPSNFVRIQKLFNMDLQKLRKSMSSYSFSDKETRQSLLDLYKKYNYVSDPHGAVAYLGLKKYASEHPNRPGFFLETAHPAKFLITVEKILKTKIAIPPQLAVLMDKPKKSYPIVEYSELRDGLISGF